MSNSSTLNITQLFERHGAFLSRTICRMVGDGPHVDDILQETFIIAYQKQHTYNPERAEVTTWLYGISANLCRRFLRSQRRFSVFKQKFATLSVAEDDVLSSRPDERVIREQDIQAMQEAISALPFKQREAFVLFEIEGLGGKEIGTLLGIREGTVWTRIHHARKRFAEYMKRRGNYV